MDNQILKEIAVELYDVGAIKYGDFVTKVGLKTPIYIDLRVIIAYPKLMVKLSKQLWSLLDLSPVDWQHVCGVPYTALPLASLISATYDAPMLMRRKEAKSYGTKKLIEGVYKQGDTAVIIEDIITSGSSVLEVARDLNKEGLNVSVALIVVDREQGGRKRLEEAGIRVRSLFRMSEIMRMLMEAGRVDEASVKVVADYIEAVQAPVEVQKNARLTQDFSTRSKSSKNPIACRILRLMSSKQSTICLAADLTQSSAILDLADLTGPHIAALKLHADMISDFDESFVAKLLALARKHDFVLMEDRKYADIGNTVAQQYRGGYLRVAEWADCVTAHALPGRGVLDGLKQGLSGVKGDRGVFVLAEMSSSGALTTREYAEAAVKLAGEVEDMVAGVVCQGAVFDQPGLVQLTPGVRLGAAGDELGQRYNSPEEVVRNGADLVVVGRGITEAKDRLVAVVEYKRVLFEAYEKRLE